MSSTAFRVLRPRLADLPTQAAQNVLWWIMAEHREGRDLMVPVAGIAREHGAPRSTYHRAIRHLMAAGIVSKTEGRYVVRVTVFDTLERCERQREGALREATAPEIATDECCERQRGVEREATKPLRDATPSKEEDKKTRARSGTDLDAYLSEVLARESRPRGHSAGVYP